MRLFIVAALLATSVLAGQRAAAATPEEQSAPVRQPEALVQYWLHQFNFCSLVCQEKINPRDDTHQFVAFWEFNDSPWFISLNEVCQSEIKDLATETGMTAAWILTKRFDEDCPGAPADQRFGNAILFRHSAVDAGHAVWFQDQADPEPPAPDCTPAPDPSGSNECRGLVCINTSTPGGVAAGCSAHLVSSPPDIAEDQSGEYLISATSYQLNGTKYLAGDFNLVSGDIHPSFASNCAVDSGDQHLTYDVIFGLEAKIDYIWLCPGSGGGGTPIRQPNCADNYSDHCYVFWQLGSA